MSGLGLGTVKLGLAVLLLAMAGQAQERMQEPPPSGEPFPDAGLPEEAFPDAAPPGEGAPPEEPIPPPQEPISEFGPLACYERAERSVDVDEARALQLCEGAESMAPALCFEQARLNTFLTIEQSVELCTCAVSTGPVACYLRASEYSFVDEWRGVRLCSPVYNRATSCTVRGFWWP